LPTGLVDRNRALMLPSLRTVLAAMFVTATFVTLVGTALMPVLPRVEQPRARLARTENPSEQSRLLSNEGVSDEHNRPRAAEPSSSPSKTIEGEASTHAKTVVTAREGPAASGVGAESALPTDEPAVNSNTQNVHLAETGSVSSLSIALGDQSAPLKGSAAPFASPLKRGADPCVFCHRALHAHGIQHRSGRWRRVRMTLDRNTAF
jgi:hypothetical protein